ncbi:hypothetical protein RHGRI_021572 [Rhododendron griersonianum]|uniref:Uncharacterized protein n=1 Tax=Rhododendron griersonianum TaxID=479676 RepID=A0AAV6JQ64_9ERIC|nr:hypothetical protein RHGRI_021572 [Rhododendron griersonianum]
MYFKGAVRVEHYSVIIYVSCLGTNAPKSQRRGARSRNAHPRALALGPVHYARQRDLVAWARRGAIAIHAQRDEVQNDQIHGEEGSQGCDHNGRSIRKRVNSDKIAADDIANPKEAKEHCHRDLKGFGVIVCDSRGEVLDVYYGRIKVSSALATDALSIIVACAMAATKGLTIL